METHVLDWLAGMLDLPGKFLSTGDGGGVIQDTASSSTLCALLAAREATGLPVMVTMTFDETPRGFFTIMGTSIEAAARGLEDEGANVVGSNCGHGMSQMVEITREFQKHTALPLIILTPST